MSTRVRRRVTVEATDVATARDQLAPTSAPKAVRAAPRRERSKGDRYTRRALPAQRAPKNLQRATRSRRDSVTHSADAPKTPKAAATRAKAASPSLVQNALGGIGRALEGVGRAVGRVFEGVGRAVQSVAESVTGGIILGLSRGVDAISTVTGHQKPPRALTERERQLLGDVYGGALDLDRVQIVRGSSLNTFAPGEGHIPRAVGNTIYWPDTGRYADLMDANGVRSVASAEDTLVHEAAHVAQFQNSGPGYLTNSVVNQLSAMVRTGSRNGAYDWESAARRGVPWSELGAEQQALLIEDAFHHGILDGGRYLSGGRDFTDYLVGALEQARAGRGWN